VKITEKDVGDIAELARLELLPEEKKPYTEQLKNIFAWMDEMYLSDIFTIPCNLAGLCGRSFPAGKSKDGLPIGVQFMARPFNEAALFTLAGELARAG